MKGDPGREMFILQKGKVQVRKKVGSGEKVLAELGDGEFFGEMALLMGMNRSATVEVIEDSKILVVSPETFENLLKSNLGNRRQDAEKDGRPPPQPGRTLGNCPSGIPKRMPMNFSPRRPQRTRRKPIQNKKPLNPKREEGLFIFFSYWLNATG